MQGTGAVCLAAVLSASHVSRVPIQDHRIIIHGSGTAGIGIADQLRDAMCEAGLTYEEATRRFYAIGRHGLLVDDRADLRDFQAPYARPRAEVSDWARDERLGGICLAEVVQQVHPTILIGTSGRPQAFTQQIVTEMAAHVERPIILPMSNPTNLAEAFPADLLAWTEGRALVATGSPFPPTTVADTTYDVAQVNNALIFPGLGLGVIVSRAKRLTDGMLRAAARAVAIQADTSSPGASLLPRMVELRATSFVVAKAVAQQATVEGLAAVPADENLEERIRDVMWVSRYHPVLAV